GEVPCRDFSIVFGVEFDAFFDELTTDRGVVGKRPVVHHGQTVHGVGVCAFSIDGGFGGQTGVDDTLPAGRVSQAVGFAQLHWVADTFIDDAVFSGPNDAGVRSNVANTLGEFINVHLGAD